MVEIFGITPSALNSLYQCYLKQISNYGFESTGSKIRLIKYSDQVDVKTVCEHTKLGKFSLILLK